VVGRPDRGAWGGCQRLLQAGSWSRTMHGASGGGGVGDHSARYVALARRRAAFCRSQPVHHRPRALRVGGGGLHARSGRSGHSHAALLGWVVVRHRPQRV